MVDMLGRYGAGVKRSNLWRRCLRGELGLLNRSLAVPSKLLQQTRFATSPPIRSAPSNEMCAGWSAEHALRTSTRYFDSSPPMGFLHHSHDATATC